jgi:hypothetical protein
MEVFVAYFKALGRHFHGGTEGNYEDPQSGLVVSGPRFAPELSRKEVIANH